MLTLENAKKILGKNFIGPVELASISSFLPILLPTSIPEIPISADELEEMKENVILILGIELDKNRTPITINYLRSHFSHDSSQSHVCFYNQDWYLKEKFAATNTLQCKRYILQKKIDAKNYGTPPQNIILPLKESLPSAILTAYTFFCYYLVTQEILRENHYIWCSDRDHKGDIIYTGRYKDPHGVNKDGFSIHRHLSIDLTYGYVSELLF